MTITVKNGFCEKLFVNETGKLLATLRSQKLFGPEKAVIGSDGVVKYVTDIENLSDKTAGENRCYTLAQNGSLVATALPEYAADADHFAMPRPPRPVGLTIQMQDDIQWRVVRSKKNAVEVQIPDGVGRLSDFFSIRPQALEIPNESDIFLWVGVYALIGYMMHEDDTYPV
ncbi:MAG: hypothetical protein LBQ42_03290 [Synergistaceae bacterium]|jgi:hypothetical protein|nr:hypothetical protein [Synergistaceae bacterium]